MTFVAPTFLSTVNHPPTTCVVNQAILTAMENAGPKRNHAVMLQLSTAQLNMTSALNTAAVEITKHVAKRERNACHTMLFAADGTNLTAMESVFQKTNTVAHTEHHGANTPTNAKNTVVMKEMDSSGANTLKNALLTVAHTTLFGAHTLESALIMRNTAAHMKLLTANGLTHAQHTVANTAMRNTKFGAQSLSNAKMNVNAVNMEKKLATVPVEPMITTSLATTKMEKNAVNTSGVNMPTSVLLMKLLAALNLDTPM